MLLAMGQAPALTATAKVNRARLLLVRRPPADLLEHRVDPLPAAGRDARPQLSP